MKNLKIQTKILLLSTTVALLLILGGFYAFEKFANNYTVHVENSIKSASEELGSKISAQFYERYGDVQAFALNPDLRTFNKKNLSNELNDYVKLYGIYDLILVVDNNGQLIASNNKGVDEKSFDNSKLFDYDFKKEKWFKAVLTNQLTEDKNKGFSGSYFESNHKSEIWSLLGKNKDSSTFSAPIYDYSGNKIGVVTNVLNNKWINEEVKNILSSMNKKGLGNPEVFISDLNNEIISHFRMKNEKVEELDSFGKKDYSLFENVTKLKDNYEIDLLIAEKEKHVVSSGIVNDLKWPSSIIWKTVVFNEEKEVLSAILYSKKHYYTISLIIFLFSLLGSYLVSRYISSQILEVSNKLVLNSNQVNDASTKMAGESVQLSESATEQASALQETMSAIDEINAMVGKNAQSAEESKKAAEESQNAVAMGKENVSHMLSSIESLGENSNHVQLQIEENNGKLEEIMKLISSIESKTKVINDIVFQTKLLSFNASVEAARAGEHGKGFAVVADEVRKLAEMSGNSSKDISSSLSSTINQVSLIIKDSKMKMERLIEESKEKVNQTINSANECQASFDSIDQSFSYVSQLVSEIATASKEQASGIEEVSKAVRQIEQGTQQISSVAESSSKNAEELKKQSDELNLLLNDLSSMVNGSNKNNSEVINFPLKNKIEKENIPNSNSPGFKKGG